MFKHVVMWRLKEDAQGKTKDENLTLMADKLKALKDEIPTISSLEVGINVSDSPNAFDIVLITSFKTKEDFIVYRDDPRHRQVVEFIKSVQEEVRAVDYEF